jgi:DNA modification methylase
MLHNQISHMQKRQIRKKPRVGQIVVGQTNGRPAAEGDSHAAAKPRAKPARRCNALDGKRWLQNSISVWSDIRKSPEELRLKHPAMFPSMLAERLIESFLPEGSQVVLDPFTGTGSTLAAAAKLGKQGVGIELSEEFVGKAKSRFSAVDGSKPSTGPRGSALHSLPATLHSAPAPILHHASAARLLELVEPGSVDLCITSPPYWDILNQRRTADMKAVRHYGNLADDLGTVSDYDDFLTRISSVFADVLQVLKPGAHCCVIVMDLRKKNRFYPFHSDLAARMQQIGYEYDDLIIWNRQAEYNNLRPLGFPAVFRVNKVHEFVLLMQKPAC